MSDHDLVQEANERQTKLDESIRLMADYGKKKAESDREYIIALAQEMTRLRNENMPATLVRDLARGSDIVSKFRFERDLNEVMYETAKESVMNHKQRIKAINDTISREWSNVR